jgi:hypothetical protein
MTEIDGGFPIYILDDDTVLYTKEDANHVDYWYDVVSKIVADKHGILQKRILNLPYCQRRARVVGANLYCGEKITKKLLKKIEKILDKKLRYIYDEHETRCELSVAEFNGLRNPYPR